jgi:predicted ATPase/DNA-binding CsgD family transcriptional regulator
MSLLEREHYLSALNGALAAVAGGTGRITLVSGEAGIGKTSLIQQFMAEQTGAARVLWGGCESLFTPHPLAPLYDVARQAGGELPGLLASAATRDTIFRATIDELARGPSPTLLVFEDVQWADESTLDLIKVLGRRIQRLGVMLVLTYRDDELGAMHPLRSVIGELPVSFVNRMPLPPLTEAAVASLAEGAGRQLSGLFEVTGGNPFFVTEALAAAEATVPATVRDAVIARIARLSDAARAIAQVTAVVPGKTERWLLQETVAADGQAMDECLGAGMVETGGSIAFRHELARRAVEDDVPYSVRQELHARILKALQQRGDAGISAARLIHHADRAGDGTEVLRLAPPAAEQAARLGAHREAAALLGLALNHADSLSAERRAELLDLLSYEAHLTNQIPEATRAREAALVLWRSTDRRAKEGDCLRWLSRLSWFGANKAAADRYAAEAVALLETLTPGPELAMAYSTLAQLHMLAREGGLARQWGEKAIRLAMVLEDSQVLCHALNNVGTAKLVEGDVSGGADLERSLELALAAGHHEHSARAFTNLATTSVRHHDLPRAFGYLARGIEFCEEHDLDSWVRYLTAFRAEAQMLQGNWQAAAEDAETIVRDLRVAPVSRIPALAVLATVRMRRGDPGVREPLEEAHRLATATEELQRIGPVVTARAEAAWLEGTLENSVEELSAAYEIARKDPDPWMRGELAFWLWRAGRLKVLPATLTDPFSQQLSGDWRGAARAWGSLGCPYEQAVALADADSEDELRVALEIFDRLGAGPMAAVTRGKLRALGVRKIPRGAQQRTKQNPHQLTKRELQVLALLADGRRNADIARRLFVTAKTVDHHVSAVLAKLSVRSRSEAAAVAIQMGLGTTSAPGGSARN